MSYAQFGEDVVVDELLGSLETGCIVDIGAGDGQHISNSALFRERGWRTVLVEPDPVYEDALGALIGPNCVVYQVPATPENINEFVPPETTVLSIDVDGDDYFLLEALVARPLVIVVEHNPTMPRHIDAAPARLGLRIGASIAALARVARAKGYGLAAATHCNVIFRLGADDVALEPDRPAYAVATEYFTGRPVVIGTPPWGMDFANPYPMQDVVVR